MKEGMWCSQHCCDDGMPEGEEVLYAGREDSQGATKVRESIKSVVSEYPSSHAEDDIVLNKYFPQGSFLPEEVLQQKVLTKQ